MYMHYETLVYIWCRMVLHADFNIGTFYVMLIWQHMWCHVTCCDWQMLDNAFNVVFLHYWWPWHIRKWSNAPYIGSSLGGRSQQRPLLSNVTKNCWRCYCEMWMHLLLPLTKVHRSNVASFLANRVALWEGDYCNWKVDWSTETTCTDIFNA